MKLEKFVSAFTQMINEDDIEERKILESGSSLLSSLITEDDWLPDKFARADAEYYQQYLLYCDPEERFSIVSVVWGPGQGTPVHDHTVWGLIGMLRGAETSERFALGGLGQPMQSLGAERLTPGKVDRVSPGIGDIHRVSNAYDDRISISIHVYGSNIGRTRRHVYNIQTGESREFISGYAN
jgi:3-mercaptopropionate dioxygenase